ncbi:transposable element Tcb1 transposase [Trichonephila clavipes]|nr:transposable element Tcb1 transposase [Trichonephila clavipes]
MIVVVNESVIGEADESKFGKIKYKSRKLVKRQLGVWRHRINALLGIAERRDSECNQRVGVARNPVCAYHSTPFTAEWPVRKTSIAWSTLDAEPQTSPPPMEEGWNEVVFTDESRICLQHLKGRIRVWRHRGERMLNSCVMHRVLCFFVNHQIDLLSWLAHSPHLSPIENMWSMMAQRLTQITPPAATPDQLWQRVEAAWSAVPPKHIQSLFELMPRRVAAVISNNGGYSGY